MSKVVFTRTARVECGLNEYLGAVKRAGDVKVKRYEYVKDCFGIKMPKIDEMQDSISYDEFKNLIENGFWISCIGEYAPNDTRENRQYFLLGLKNEDTGEFIYVAIKERDLQVAVQGYED